MVALSQSKLREQVEGLLTRMNSQLIERDPAFAKIAELLPQAVTAMKEAEGKLQAVAPDRGAAAREQGAAAAAEGGGRVRDADQRAAEGGGGGGGGGGAMQQELAELFDQELDKMASRYETANQASEQRTIARSTSCSRS